MPFCVFRFNLPKLKALDGLTAIGLLVPATDGLPVSFAVIVMLPFVRRVAVNVPVPLVSVESNGSDALPSELLKRTVPP